jgi:UDP-glucose 4-epimerase
VKRALVTGASGFVGANLARRLLRDGHEVHLLVRPEHDPGRIEGLCRDAAVHVAPLGDREALERAVAKVRPEWIFHLAAHGAYSWQTDLEEMTSANIHGAINLISAALRTGFEAFVNTGSSSEYGFKDHAPVESEMLEPNSHYAVTKAAATLFARYTAQSRGVHLPTLRLYSVYGPYEDPRRLVPTLIREGLSGRLPPLVDPDVARDFVHVDDVVEAYLLAAQSPTGELGAVYNVATGVATTIREAVGVARGAMGIAAEPAWSTMPNRSWDSAVWVGDARKIRAALGWRPRLDFAAGFARTVEWFREHAG